MPIVDPFKSQQKGGIVDPFKTRKEREEPTPPKKEGVPERTWGEAVKDIGAAGLGGIGSLVQLPGQLYGLATGDFSKTGALGAGEDIEEYAKGLKSKALLAKEAARSEKVAQAEKQGQLAAFKTALGETITDPALLTSFLAEQLPQLVPSVITGGGAAALTSGRALAKELAKGTAKEAAEAEAKKAAIKSGAAAAVQTGAVQQGADIGAGTYDEIYKELSKTMSPEKAGAATINYARAAGVAGYGLSVLANRYLPGADALERVLAGERTGKGILRGAVTGALKELPSENVEEVGSRLAQNIAARTAGLDRDLTSGLGETAAMASLGAAGMGGITGGVGGARSYVAGSEPTKQIREIPDWIKKDLEGEGNVEPPITEPSGTSTSVASKPGAGSAAAGAGETKPDGVVSTRQDAADADTGAGKKSVALSDFTEAYNSLREELVPLLGGGIQTPEKTAQIAAGVRDLNRMVDENAALINDKNLIEQLKNPMFDGSDILAAMASQEQVGQPLAMQGNLFGKFVNGSRAAQLAISYTGSPEAALKFLQERKQKLLDDLASGKLDAAWAQKIGARYGMTQGESVKNYQKVAELYTQSAVSEVDEAIDQVSKQTGTPKAMQGNLFNKPLEEGPPAESLADVFGSDQTAGLEGKGENLTFENQAAFDAYQARQKKSAESEKRNKAQAGVASPTMTPQERLDVLTARETDLVGRLEKAETQKIGSSVGATEGSLKQGLQNELNAVRREIRVAQTEAANAKPAPAPVTKVAPEQVDMFGKPAEKEEKSKKQEQKQAKKTADEILAEDKKERELPASLIEEDEAFAVGKKDESRLTDEEAAQQAEMDEQRRKVKETVKAPEEDTEHVFETKEAKFIKQFLDSVKPATKPGSEEAQKHVSLKDVIYKMLAGFDIVKPGETTTPGMQDILKHLEDRVGGKANFQKLVDFLKAPGAMTQSQLLRASGFPDLTTRRGLETFSEQIKRFINSLGAEKLGGQGVKIPFAKLPYVTEVKGTVKKAVTPPATPTNLLRRPSMKQEGKPYKISDTRLRGAWITLKQMFESKGELTPEMEAARNYITNPTRKSFGFVLADLAQDIANWDAFLERKYNMRAADVKELTPAERKALPQTKEETEYGRNTTFYGEGGMYSEQFQRWIEQNLDAKTVATLNEMVADERANMEEEARFDKAVTAYRAEIKRRQTASAETRIKKAETTSGVKMNRAPKKRTRSEVIFDSETQGDEAIVETPVDLSNIPEKAKLPSAVVQLLKNGNLKGALEILASKEASGYYKSLAQRLLDAKLTAKTKVIPKYSVESLSNDPRVKETLQDQLRALDEMVRTSLPESQQKKLTDGLRSKDLYEIAAAVEELQTAFTNPSQQQIVAETARLMNKEFSWFGKYDPASDTITLREGALDNHLLFHESLHAATSNLIDNPEKLQGVRKEGYSRLVELYNYSKGMLSNSQLGADHIYGLTNLSEFVSEAMTNPVFQIELRKLRYKAAPYSLWNEFTTAIKKLFKVESETDSDVLVEVMKATDAMIAGPMSIDNMDVKSTPKAMATQMVKTVPIGAVNTPTALNKLMTSKSWNDVKNTWPTVFSSASASARPAMLGALTLRQISDLVRNRIPQVRRFIGKTEEFLARKNGILQESGDISKRWERLQSSNPEMSRLIAKVMHTATILGVDPDKATPSNRKMHPELMEEWRKLNPAAKQIYRDARDFYERRYSEYRDVLTKRMMMMRQQGVSAQTITDLMAARDGISKDTLKSLRGAKFSDDDINRMLRAGPSTTDYSKMTNSGITSQTMAEIRAEFEKSKLKTPYFPLMRHGRFWYQIGTGKDREYYMFETQGQKEMHMAERIKQNPDWVIKEGSEYAEQMDIHARQSEFLKDVFEAIDGMNFTGANATMQAQELKDSIYQTYLSNQPESSFRKQFMHRNNIAGYSEDALRNFASSSFHMAYQLSRFEHAPELFLSVQSAREQIKDRFDAGAKNDVKLSRENTELSDYVTEMDRRLKLMLNPTNVGTIPSLLSNVGFIWYLTAPASAIVNVLGGMIIGLPTLIGMNVRANPGMSYTQATLNALGHMRQAAGQIISTGFGIERGERLRDNRVLFPTLSRYDGLSKSDKQAYNRFVADGLIDITAAYDQSGLAAAPTESYGGVRHRAMELLTSLFHNAERFNREVMAMSAFRAAMDKRKGYKDQSLAFDEAIAEAKDVTNRSMFDYSAANKPRYFQHPVASVVLQFKQFPQQMTFFLAHNAYNMFKGLSPEERREARARFVGTMGMAGIFSGVTGLWGFSIVASIINAVFNGLGDDDEEPFDFEIEFMRWATETFGKNIGTMLTRGVGNAAGIDLASRVKLDDMWFRDSRKNQDEVEALQTFLVDLLGPTAGLAVNVAQASKLLNEGHADRALEMISPAFIKNPLVAARYANEGVNTLRGDPLMEDMGPFHLLMQSLGIRSSELAERQWYNVQVKGREQEVLKQRQNLLNLYGISFMSNDASSFEKALNKIFEFNAKNPSVAIPADSLNRSIKERFTKSAQTDHGLYIDKRMRGVLSGESYLD
jgi:hypothetical protein